MKFLVSLIFFLFGQATAAHAVKVLPSWNMKAFCADRLGPAGSVPSSAAVADCVQLQNEARDRVRSGWSQLDEVVRKECLDLLQADLEIDSVPPSYVRLEHCLEFEMKKRD
jgi:hypothetical protein